MRELALHLLDITENAVSAQADTVWIEVEEDSAADRLRMSVKDNGTGMSPDVLAQVVDPFYTSRTTRKVGLGIPLLKAAAEVCLGKLEIESQPGQGTTLRVDFLRSHIDRMPLGDLSSTMLALVVGSPDVRWCFRYSSDGKVFEFDSRPIMEILGDSLPLSDPAVLAYLRELLESGVAQVQEETIQP